MYSLQVTGVDEINKDFDQFSQDVQEDLLTELKHLTGLVKNKAYENAPKDTGKGALSMRSNVGITKFDKPFGTVTCGGGDEYYMRMQEYGTSRFPGKAFMRKALDGLQNVIVQSLSAIIKRVKWQ